MNRRAMLLPLLLASSLASCNAAERLSNGEVIEPSGAVIKPNGTVIEPSGAIIEPSGQVIEPHASSIETVITGLSEAQQVRALTRQLAR